MKAWIDSFAGDVDVVEKIVESKTAPKQARVLAAGALSYLVKQMDLIPDWEPVHGLLDDAMVLRVAVSIASEQDLGDFDADTTRGIGRLANEADQVAEMLGADLYGRLKRYVQGLVRLDVRGRRADFIASDSKARAQLFAEIAGELKKIKPAKVDDEEQTLRKVKGYLEQKLPK
jgi:uncharacterized membrane protein YkvA (DUF1232 family)